MATVKKKLYPCWAEASLNDPALRWLISNNQHVANVLDSGSLQTGAYLCAKWKFGEKKQNVCQPSFFCTETFKWYHLPPSPHPSSHVGNWSFVVSRTAGPLLPLHQTPRKNGAAHLRVSRVRVVRLVGKRPAPGSWEDENAAGFLVGLGNSLAKYTPPKFNMEPEKKSLEKEAPLGNHHFQVPC